MSFRDFILLDEKLSGLKEGKNCIPEDENCVINFNRDLQRRFRFVIGVELNWLEFGFGDE